MALTKEQTDGLQYSYKKLRAQGLDQAAATAKLKETMVKEGVYEKAKALYQAPAPAVPNAAAPVNVSATPRGSVARENAAGTPVDAPAAPSSVPTAPVAPAPAKVENPAAPVQSGGTDSTGQIVQPGMTSFDTSAGKDLTKPGAPVSTSAPAPAIPSAPVNADRSQEILNNLREGQKNAPQLFQDYGTFKNAYGYDQKPAEEKAQLDAFFQSANKRSADQLIDMAIARQDLTPYKGTPEFVTAQRVGRAVLDYSKMSPAQLAEKMGMMEADLLPGSKAYDVLSKANPQLVAAAEKIKDDLRRSGMTQYDESGKTKVNKLPDAETSVSESILANADKESVTSLAAALGTKEIKDAREKVSATRTELDTLYDTVENVEEDVRKELKGTGATESYIRAMISERTKPLMKSINSLERKYANQAGELKNLTDTATDNFKYQAEIASEQRRFQQQMLISQMQTQASQSFQARQQAAQFAQQERMAGISYANESARIEDQQRFQQQMQKAQFDQQVRMENVKYSMDNSGYESKTAKDASGNDVTTYFKKGNPRDSMTFDASGSLVSVGGKQVPPRTEQVADAYSVSKQATSDRIGSIGGQCTKWASDKMQQAGFGRALSEGLRSDEDDTLAFKASKTNTSVPSIGSAIALNNGTKYGHWGIVTGIGSNGTISYTSSNEKGDQKITSSNIRANDRNVIGYYNPNFSSKAQAAQKSDSDDDIINAIMNGSGDIDSLDVKTRTRVLPKLDAKVQAIKSQGGDPIYIEMAASAVNSGKPSETAKTQFKKSMQVVAQLSDLNDLLAKDEAGNTAPLTGWLRSKNPWDTDAQTIKAAIQSIVPNLARGIYGEVGVLTDQDIQNYIQTIPNLRSTDKVKAATLALTLKAARNGIADSIRIEAAGKSDVSGFAPVLKDLDAKISSIESNLVGNKKSESSSTNMDDYLKKLGY